jgi:hypothetical protein
MVIVHVVVGSEWEVKVKVFLRSAGAQAPTNHSDASVKQFLYFGYHEHEDVSRNISFYDTLPVYTPGDKCWKKKGKRIRPVSKAGFKLTVS